MHIILVGDTEVVYYLARRFIGQGHEVVIVHDDEARCQQLALQTKATVVLGDSIQESTLEAANAREADVLIALSPQDQTNLITCQIADRVFGVPRTIAIANDPNNERIFHQLGVKVAFSPTQVVASIVEQEITFEQITQLMPLARGRVNVTDLHLEAQSKVVGKKLADLNLGADVLVACVIREDDVIVPRGQTKLAAGDHLILIHHHEQSVDDLELFNARHRS